MEPLPKFDVTLTVSRTDGEDIDYKPVKELVCKVKQEWHIGMVEAKLLSGGFINSIVKVSTSDGADQDAVIVKVLSPKSRIREDRETMVTVMRIAEAGGVGAPVLAEFNNGLIYGFTVGELLNPDVWPHDSHIQGLTAKELAKFHSINPDLYLKDHSVLPKEPRLFRDIHHFLSLIPENFSDMFYKNSKPCMTRQQYLEELHWLECEVRAPDGKIPDEIVFCHNDAWWGNQIYNKEKDQINLIDFDLCNFNYATRDIATYFGMGRMELIPNTLYRWHMFWESEKAAFIKVYLEERDRLRGGEGNACQTDIDRMIYIGKPMEMFMALDRVPAVYSINNHEGPLDCIWGGNEIWRHYYTLKKEYMVSKTAPLKD